MRKWYEGSANILFWLLTGWLLTNSFSVQFHEVEMIDGVETVKIVRNFDIVARLLIVICISLIMFYSNIWNIMRLKVGASKIKVIIISIVIFVIGYGFFRIIEILPVFTQKIPLPLSLSSGTMTFYYAISTTYGIGILWQHSENIRQKLDLEKKQAELSLLRSQLHPHFLFNTLNNLLAMVDQQENPTLAGALTRLSGLLRYVVYDTAAGKVPISREIEFIRNFSELQKLRFEKDEVCFELNIKGDFTEQLAEPGIFIPFVENAFKYGAEAEKVSHIMVSFDLTQSTVIRFECENPIHPALQKLNGNGSGIESSRERLKLVYPQKHKLKITKNESFKVELEIETHESNSSR
ncbi:MAG: histidine kinase [Calditrichaeota bacterium]|nr:histidine kinase [Calditrichota bacterium]